MRQLAVHLPFLALASCCLPLQNTSYRHSAHLASMNLSIYFDLELAYLADEVACRLNGSFAAVHSYRLNKTTKMADFCGLLKDRLRFTGLVQVTITIGRLAAGEEEAVCSSISANLLHLKELKDDHWLAHLLTRRSDHLFKIGAASNASVPAGLTKALELMMAISGPVLTLPMTGVYKTQQAEQKRQKEAAGQWIKVLLGVGLGSLAALVLIAATVIGTVAYRRRAKRKEQKSRQLAQKTNEAEEQGQFQLELEEDEPRDS